MLYQWLNLLISIKYDRLSKTSHVHIKTEIHFIPQLTATLHNYACSLPPLANVNWSPFPECFFPTMQIHYWWKGINGEVQFGSGDLILLSLSAHTCLGLVMEYWPFVGACERYAHFRLYHCVILLLCFSHCHHPPHPCAPPLYTLTQY